VVAHYFARRVFEKNNLREKSIDQEVLAALRRHSWPGNIRELQKLMERLVIMSGERIVLSDLPADIATSSYEEREAMVSTEIARPSCDTAFAELPGLYRRSTLKAGRQESAGNSV
jgi:DNA-binding NtrC family response regulator